MKKKVILFLLLVLNGGLSAQDLDLDLKAYPTPPDTPSQVLIRNATVWTMTGDGILQNSDVLLVDGKISQVGSGLEAPGGALVIDAAGKHVTPGLIDAHSHSAVEGFGVNEGSNSVTAEVRVADALDPDDRYIYLQLAGGLTAANILHGSANAIGGQNAVIKLRWGAVDPQSLLIESAPPGIKFALGENPKRSAFGGLPGIPGRYPQTRMGVEATIRNALQDAVRYRDEWKSYNALSEAEQQRREPPRKNLQLDALVEILEGERLVHSHSYRADEILMLLRLADEFGFTVRTLQHVLEGYRVADEIAAHGAGGSTFSDWWSYKLEAYEAIPYNAALMTERGVLVSLNSDNGNLARRMNTEAAKTQRYGGLSPEQALALVTINPARQLQIDDHVGSLAAGKDADVVVWNGDPLSIYSTVDYTLVDGRVLFSRAGDHEHREALRRHRADLTAAIRNAGKESEPTEEEAAPDEETAEPAEAVEILKNVPAPAFEYRDSPHANARAVAIIGATVHTLEGDPIENGTVVIEDGRITAVGGGGTRVPRGAERVDARGKHLWPGMIQMQSVLGLNEIDSVAGSVDVGEMGDWNANIHAHLAVHAASAHIPVTRNGGVTHAVTAPTSGKIAGTAALIRTHGWTWEEMAAVPAHSLHIQWEGGGGGFAAFFGQQRSLADQKKASEDRARELTVFFDDARAYAKARARVESAGSSWEPDPNFEAMLPVLDGSRPLYVSVDNDFAIRAAVNWAAEQELRIVVVGGREAWRIADWLAEREIPVVLNGVMGDPVLGDDPYDVYHHSPAVLAEAGVLVAIAGSDTPGGSSNSRNIPFFAGFAAGFGLDREEAYRTVTLNPARMLGLDDVLGSIAVGKSGSLVLTDGDLLEPGTTIEKVWIDGAAPPMTDKHKELYELYRSRPKVTLP